ncbi:hypothetical protein [Aminobacter carboxidus]|uniref:hypothetical protein n=1 Tax=Aminobacter carboxidus TaxID=376165 RepID=UPI001AEE7AED|nr:hypothetical protein [Aminobacter lissarensis]
MVPVAHIVVGDVEVDGDITFERIVEHRLDVGAPILGEVDRQECRKRLAGAGGEVEAALEALRLGESRRYSALLVVARHDAGSMRCLLEAEDQTCVY